jgi:hypothetical protein
VLLRIHLPPSEGQPRVAASCVPDRYPIQKNDESRGNVSSSVDSSAINVADKSVKGPFRNDEVIIPDRLVARRFHLPGRTRRPIKPTTSDPCPPGHQRRLLSGSKGSIERRPAFNRGAIGLSYHVLLKSSPFDGTGHYLTQPDSDFPQPKYIFRNTY